SRRGLGGPGRGRTGLPGHRRETELGARPADPTAVRVQSGARPGVHSLPHRPGAALRTAAVRTRDAATQTAPLHWPTGNGPVTRKAGVTDGGSRSISHRVSMGFLTLATCCATEIADST